MDDRRPACAVPSCSKTSATKHLCTRHYSKWRYELLHHPADTPADASEWAGAYAPAGSPTAKPSCRLGDCSKHAGSKGLCSTHYGRWAYHHRPDLDRWIANGGSLEDRAGAPTEPAATLLDEDVDLQALHADGLISTRLCNTLLRAGIRTYNEVLQYGVDRIDSLRGAGAGALDEVIRVQQVMSEGRPRPSGPEAARPAEPAVQSTSARPLTTDRTGAYLSLLDSWSDGLDVDTRPVRAGLGVRMERAWRQTLAVVSTFFPDDHDGTRDEVARMALYWITGTELSGSHRLPSERTIAYTQAYVRAVRDALADPKPLEWAVAYCRSQVDEQRSRG